MTKRRIIYLLTVASIALPATASAQVLEAGDELKVRIPPSGAKLLTVDRDGKVDLDGYGYFAVAGKTVPAAQKELRVFMSRFIRNTNAVKLSLHKAGRLVLITGKVKKPGMVTIGKDDDVWRAISLAGGPSPGADLTRVLLATRGPGGKMVERNYNVASYLSGSREVVMPKVKRGDTIFVPAGAGLNVGQPGSVFLSDAAVANKVFVLGAVSRPGMYDRPGNLSALAALAIAGGPTPQADMTNVRVTTKEGVSRLDVAAWLSGQAKDAPRIPDAGGVIVYVPSVPGKEGGGASLGQSINIIGSVTTPGRVSVGGATPLVDVVSMAGGATEKGDLGDVRVVQRGERFTLATSYDMDDYMSDGGLVAHVMINPGDSVYVDSDMGLEIFNSTVNLVSTLASLATAFLLFSTAVSQ